MVNVVLNAQRGALPAEFPGSAWGIIAAGVSDLAWAAEPAMQHFWLHVKSSVSLTGQEPVTQLHYAAFFPARVVPRRVTGANPCHCGSCSIFQAGLGFRGTWI